MYSDSTKRKKLYLISNAHIDPCWQWNVEEGIGAAISTFRAAADILEEDERLIFNHNESVLYEWVEKYAPELFARIQKLVRAGRWHIAGGWYLQPDCNMPSGESLIRQILVGRNYFTEKFGAEPTVAVNYDSFGHSDGLVQILADAGYIGYICMRPQDNPEHHDVVWVGFCGSRVLLHRAVEGYNTLLGQVGKRYEEFAAGMKGKSRDLMLWGVGNHGGGPSREDLAWLNRKIDGEDRFQVVHATPEEYFETLRNEELPELSGNRLNPLMQGCYTSQVRIKQLHHQLENELYCAERMNAQAVANGAPDQSEALRTAQKDLLFCEFHDILPGTVIKEAEERAIGQLYHGLHIAQSVKNDSFFSLTGGQKPAAPGEFPVLIYNPHPYEWETDAEVELMLADQNWSLTERNVPVITKDGIPLVCQELKESSNIPLDWRKKFAVRVKLPPMTVQRLSCRFELRPAGRTAPEQRFSVRTDRVEFSLDPATGAVAGYRVDGEDYLLPGSGEIFIVESSCDPWGFHFDDGKALLGKFVLATRQQARRICNDDEAEPIRVIEDGALRTVLEVLEVYRESTAVLRYTVSRFETAVGLEIRINHSEKDKKIKLRFRTAVKDMEYSGKTVFGVNRLEKGREQVAQQWTMADNGTKAFSLLNAGTYGSHAEGDDICMTLLHPAAYTAHPIEDRKILRSDRYYERMDQGERVFRFQMNGSDSETRKRLVGREDVLFQQPPMALNYFPTGEGHTVPEFLRLQPSTAVLSCFKRAEDGNGWIFRVFNPTRDELSFRLTSASLGLDCSGTLESFRFRTYRLGADGVLKEVNCIERNR